MKDIVQENSPIVKITPKDLTEKISKRESLKQKSSGRPKKKKKIVGEFSFKPSTKPPCKPSTDDLAVMNYVFKCIHKKKDWFDSIGNYCEENNIRSKNSDKWVKYILGNKEGFPFYKAVISLYFSLNSEKFHEWRNNIFNAIENIEKSDNYKGPQYSIHDIDNAKLTKADLLCLRFALEKIIANNNWEALLKKHCNENKFNFETQKKRVLCILNNRNKFESAFQFCFHLINKDEIQNLKEGILNKLSAIMNQRAQDDKNRKLRDYNTPKDKVENDNVWSDIIRDGFLDSGNL